MSDPPGPKGEVTKLEPTRNERLIARRSAESRATVPTIEYQVEVEMTAARAPTPNERVALLVRACALALRAVPRANAAYRDGAFELYSRVNVGVTVTAPGVYAIPTLYDADTKTAAALGAELETLTDRAYAGTLTAPELSSATFTLTAALGTDEPAVQTLTPLVIPPQAAALAAGPVREVTVIRAGEVTPARTMALTLACDHRILYGAYATELLAQIKARLEETSS